MARPYLKDVPKVKAEEIDGETFVEDEHGRIDFRRVVKPARSVAQNEASRKYLEKMGSEDLKDFIHLQKRQEDDSESYYIFLVYTSMSKFLSEYTNLQKSDYSRLVYLSTFLIREDSRLKYNKVSVVKRKDIKEVLKSTDSTAKRFIKRATDAGLMHIDETKTVHLNTDVFVNGSVGKATNQRHFARVFINNARRLYDAFNEGKKLESLGILYSLVPYIDMKYNVLCSNANEKVDNIFQLKPLSMEDVADILGMSDVYKVKKTLLALAVPITPFDGIPFNLSVVALTELGQNDMKLMTINPFIIYRNSEMNLGEMQTHLLFKEEIQQFMPLFKIGGVV